jgi:hypothetical protein
MKWQGLWPNTAHTKVWEVRVAEINFTLRFDTRKEARCQKRLLRDCTNHFECAIFLREWWGLWELEPKEVT